MTMAYQKASSATLRVMRDNLRSTVERADVLASESRPMDTRDLAVMRAAYLAGAIDAMIEICDAELRRRAELRSSRAKARQ